MYRGLREVLRGLLLPVCFGYNTTSERIREVESPLPQGALYFLQPGAGYGQMDLQDENGSRICWWSGPIEPTCITMGSMDWRP
jgi:hypothetical protein